jgi:rhodanese-related sulfurtransferase
MKNDQENSVSSITSKEAFELIQQQPNAILVDVRSTMEFLMIGHPTGAIHIAWLDEPDWEPNQNFARQIRELLLGGVICSDDGCLPVFLICRSGNRSLEAGEVLVKAGLRNVYSISDGFEGPRDEDHHRGTIAGWRFGGLPWEQC